MPASASLGPVARVARAFAPDGALARRYPGYRHRPGQRELARAIAETLETRGRLLAEAGTGSGKTLAYLVPTLGLGGRACLSTHTKALQDQLWDRDLPAVMKALGLRRDAALLKGRTNYLCPYRLERRLRLGAPPELVRALVSVRAWGERSADGDLSSAPMDVAALGVAGWVTATADQCLGGQCPEIGRCPLMRARRRAQEADIVVVNHALLLADLALRADEAGALLPEFDACVLDEAHAFADAASRHFGFRLSLRRLRTWLADWQEELRVHAPDAEALAEMRRAFARVEAAWAEGVPAAIGEAFALVRELAAAHAGGGPGLARLAWRADEIADALAVLAAPPGETAVWSEGEGEARVWQAAPVEPGALLADHLWSREAAFVLVSATLRVGGRFDYARARLGLEGAREHLTPSPFDYGRQALLFVPRGMSGARGRDEERLFATIVRLVRASRGRAFVLFTAWGTLRRLAPRLAAALPWPVLVQGEGMGREAMLEAFRAHGSAVLAGVRSFWEGVDVPGEALSLVVMDKIPFPPPDDPLVAARARRIEQAGGNPFREVLLPEAARVLRQGAGRLVRSERDRGVIAVLDSRLLERGYGRDLLAELPPAPLVHDIEAVERFFGGGG